MWLPFGLPNQYLCIQSRHSWVHGTLSMCTRRMILHASRRIGKTKMTGPQPFMSIYTTENHPAEKSPSKWAPPEELDLCNWCLMTQVVLDSSHAILLAYLQAGALSHCSLSRRIRIQLLFCKVGLAASTGYQI